MASEKQWAAFQRGDELLHWYYEELDHTRRNLMVPYILEELPGFWDLNDEGKLIFMKLIDHSLKESLSKDDFNDFRVPTNKKVTSNIEFTSVVEYKNYIQKNALRELLFSQKLWMIPGLLTTLVTTPSLTDDKKLVAVNYLLTIAAYLKCRETRDLISGLDASYESVKGTGGPGR